jgi:hypothetical protein
MCDGLGDVGIAQALHGGTEDARQLRRERSQLPPHVRPFHAEPAELLQAGWRCRATHVKVTKLRSNYDQESAWHILAG